jgi:flagellar biosynthesis GTPase FlhF
MSVIALVNVVTVPAQHGRNWKEAQARREREIQACMRPAGVAFQKAISEAQQNLKEAQREAQQAYSAAIHKDKSDAARAAARKAKQEALRKAQEEARQAHSAAQQAMHAAEQSCRNPKQPETTNNNSGNKNSNNPTGSSARGCGGNNSTGGTLGHGPRPRNPSVRMDLRVVDETGRPVRGVKTKLWSERQSNGLSCETIHTTDPCGNVLMDPIHITKTLQLKLEAKGFEPQMIQVEPSQLDRPFRAVMQAKKPY